MKYAVVECINSNYVIKTEHGDKQSAIIKFHQECAGLWNASDVKTATVKILDENLDCVEGYSEFIFHADAE